MRYFTYIVFLFFFLPQITYAQPKPKRDTSKDKSVIDAKRKEEQAKKETELTTEHRKKQVKTRNTHNKRATPVIQTATYLRVNQSTSLSKVLDSKGGKVSFDVATDGKDWTINNLPYWCHVTKYTNRFDVTYDANLKREYRQSWLEVKSDNQQVRINVFQRSAAPVRVNLSHAYLSHNVYVAPLGKCLKITFKVTVSEAADQKLRAVAFILDEEGNSVKAKNGYQNYAGLPSNDIYVAREIAPSTNDEETFTITLYLPNNAMNLLKKRNKLQCRLVVYNEQTNDPVSYTMRFRAKSKHGIVTTKHSK